MPIGLWPTIGVKPKRGSFENRVAFRSSRDHLARDGAAEVLLSLHPQTAQRCAVAADCDAANRKPSGKVHASQPILARKPRYPTEKTRARKFSQIEDTRELGFLSERIPQTLGNASNRGTSRGIPRFLCPILPFDVYLFREARPHARHSPPPRRAIHAIVNGKNQLVAARGASSAGESPQREVRR